MRCRAWLPVIFRLYKHFSRLLCGWFVFFSFLKEIFSSSLSRVFASHLPSLIIFFFEELEINFALKISQIQGMIFLKIIFHIFFLKINFKKLPSLDLTPRKNLIMRVETCDVTEINSNMCIFMVLLICSNKELFKVFGGKKPKSYIHLKC